MLIWADFEINKVFAKIHDNKNENNPLSFGEKFTIITLEDQGWEYSSDSSICSKIFKNKNELKKILRNIEVPENGINDIILQV